MPARRQAILAALLARVQAITVAGGYQTDAGQVVFLGETPGLGPDDPDQAIVIVVGEENPTYQGEHIFLRLPIEIQAIAKADSENPWLTVEAIVADIKTAVEQPDRTLGGLVRRQIERGVVRSLPREPGSTTVGAGVTYVAPYLEAWGNP